MAEPLTVEAGEKPLATSFKKCHILKREDSSPKRDSNPRNSIGGRKGLFVGWLFNVPATC